MNLPQYRNFPFGAGNARNSWFWGAVLLLILIVLFNFAKRSGYDIISGRTGNGVDFSLSGESNGNVSTMNLKLVKDAQKK